MLSHSFYFPFFLFFLFKKVLDMRIKESFYNLVWAIADISRQLQYSEKLHFSKVMHGSYIIASPLFSSVSY